MRLNQVLLNLHLINTSDRDITGKSGFSVRGIVEAQVVHRADILTAAVTQLEIPPGRVVQHGWCTIQADATIFGAGPHMHGLGVHLKAVAHSSLDGDTTLFDVPFDPDAQLQYALDPLRVARGDKISLECTYENPSHTTVRYGDRVQEEMGTAVIFRYPAAAQGFFFCDR